MTSNHQAVPDTTKTQDCAYNLFRSREFPDIVCAVPEICPIPRFIDPEQWAFEHPLRPEEARPPGFHDKVAKTAVRFNGFYLFYTLASAPVVQASLDMMLGGL